LRKKTLNPSGFKVFFCQREGKKTLAEVPRLASPPNKSKAAHAEVYPWMYYKGTSAFIFPRKNKCWVRIPGWEFRLTHPSGFKVFFCQREGKKTLAEVPRLASPPNKSKAAHAEVYPWMYYKGTSAFIFPRKNKCWVRIPGEEFRLTFPQDLRAFLSMGRDCRHINMF